MAVVGFAVTSPSVAMSMLDSNKWRPVIWANTPRSLQYYQEFIASLGAPSKKDNRKPILLLFGVGNLSQVRDDLSEFSSVFLFDDVQNLAKAQDSMSGFSIVDTEMEGGTLVPKQLTPSDLADIVASVGVEGLESSDLLSKVKDALISRRPSVLEVTGQMPVVEGQAHSGVRRLLNDIKHVLEVQDSSLPFALVVDQFSKFLFRIVTRAKVTASVSNKMPTDAKDLWDTALDFAKSGIGLRMAYAFRSLCDSKDPDYRIGHAVARYGLKPYSGDFLYFCSIFSPSANLEFLSSLTAEEEKTLLESESTE